jgi:hypothetical protein
MSCERVRERERERRKEEESEREEERVGGKKITKVLESRRKR